MKHIDKLVMELQQKPDELALQIHLGSKATQPEWSVLEQKWEKFAPGARLENSADNTSAATGIFETRSATARQPPVSQ